MNLHLSRGLLKSAQAGEAADIYLAAADKGEIAGCRGPGHEHRRAQHRASGAGVSRAGVSQPQRGQCCGGTRRAALISTSHLLSTRLGYLE